jgi:hypothetical protein
MCSSALVRDAIDFSSFLRTGMNGDLPIALDFIDLAPSICLPYWKVSGVLICTM